MKFRTEVRTRIKNGLKSKVEISTKIKIRQKTFFAEFVYFCKKLNSGLTGNNRMPGKWSFSWSWPSSRFTFSLFWFSPFWSWFPLFAISVCLVPISTSPNFLTRFWPWFWLLVANGGSRVSHSFYFKISVLNIFKNTKKYFGKLILTSFF